MIVAHPEKTMGRQALAFSAIMGLGAPLSMRARRPGRPRHRR
ncbi:hypothetical protein CHELA1G11_20694 [Hyphomicrobiales bacterium]|nr:hypothetical protein CHELA1G11_20694 [Hyphomicrobiales bacterium]CAH1691469.1 hypothetical protein CHELA1G2_21009 [Hyphomicrobiales bacterium]